MNDQPIFLKLSGRNIVVDIKNIDCAFVSTDGKFVMVFKSGHIQQTKCDEKIAEELLNKLILAMKVNDLYGLEPTKDKVKET